MGKMAYCQETSPPAARSSGGWRMDSTTGAVAPA